MAQSRRRKGEAQTSAATKPRTFRTFLLMQQLAAQEIGARIAEARKLRGLTQEELAEISPFSRRSLQDYERGETIPYRHLREIARLLNRPEEWFLYGETEPEAAVPAADAAEILQRLERIEKSIAQLAARDLPDATEAPAA